MVSTKDEPDSSLPPAVDGLLRVHKRLDGLENDFSHASSVAKQISICMSYYSAKGLSIFALQDDRVVELLGDPTGVHKAIELTASHQKNFLSCRSVTPIFYMNVSMYVILCE
ncbi:hypothetical protein HN51_059602 [Arachis hypogaea]